MKHSLNITLILVALFLMAQLVGLITINKHIQAVKAATGEIVIEHPDTAIGESPKVENKSVSFIYIMIGVLAGTLLLLLLAKFKFGSVWKYWFLLSIILTMAVSFGVYINFKIAFLLAIALGLWKIYRPNAYVHNFTELFIYTGVVIVFLPILNLTSVFILLVLISLYDMYAVWKSKHMVKLAEFQAESHIFAGLFLPYSKNLGKKDVMVDRIKRASANEGAGMTAKDREKLVVRKKMKNAVLGGGDIAFPLLFSGAVMEYLITAKSIAKPAALGFTGIISLCAAAALLALLLKAKEDRFYPAMPFITAGCFIGFGIIWLLV